MSDLPKDALYQIFARLPIKSLARFRCVCKLWCNYIDDPYLASINVKQTIPMMLHQYHSLPEQSAGREFNIIESEEGNSTIFKVKQDPIYRFQCNRDPIVDIGICNGMIFFSQYDISSCTHFSVIHPLRKERYELPFLDLQFPLSCPNAYGLGFDDSTKTFKVVCLFDRDPISTDSWGGLWAMVHVLGTYSWRKIPHIPDCSLMQGQGVFVKGLLHWVNDPFGKGHSDIRKVIYFDVTKEEFGVIDPPPKPTISTLDQLVNIHDKLGYVYQNDDSVRVWTLKHKEWVLYCQFHRARPFSGNGHISLHGLGCCNEDGDLLIRERNDRGPWQFYIYKLKSGDLHEVNINGLEDNSKIILYQSHLSSSIHHIKKVRPATTIDLIKETLAETCFEALYSFSFLADILC